MSGHGVAMVTAAGRGIGRAIAEGALACGYLALAVDKDPSGIESLAAAAQGPGQAHALPFDLTDFERTAEWVHSVVAEFGTPDVLFNNAGSARFGLPDEIADVALFLASDAARYVSGQNLIVDGGALSMAGTPLAGASL